MVHQSRNQIDNSNGDGDGVGSIVFEVLDLVAVVTGIADKLLLAAVGPSIVEQEKQKQKYKEQKQKQKEGQHLENVENHDGAVDEYDREHHHISITENDNPTGSSSSPSSTSTTTATGVPNQHQQHDDETTSPSPSASQVGKTATNDVDHLSSTTSPSDILLALESKSAALGKFLGHKLRDLRSPDDF